MKAEFAFDGYMTWCRIRNNDNEYIGWSHCGDKDRYSILVGAGIAAARAYLASLQLDAGPVGNHTLGPASTTWYTYELDGRQLQRIAVRAYGDWSRVVGDQGILPEIGRMIETAAEKLGGWPSMVRIDGGRDDCAN